MSLSERVCFLFGAAPSEYQIFNRFLDSFRRFGFSSQAEIAIVFDSAKNQVEFFQNLQSIPKSSAEVKLDDKGEFFTFDSPSESQKNFSQADYNFQPDEVDDDDAGNIFFFMGDQKNSKPSQPKISQQRSSSSPIEDPGVRLTPLVLPQEYLALCNAAGTFRARSFYALNQLKRNFDYIFVCELNQVIVKNVDLLSLCQNFFAQKILWGNEISGNNPTTDWIRTSCTKWFSQTLDWHRVLSPLYLWFNQPFLYRTKDLDEFFEVTQLLENLTAIAWTDFPYYIYMYYLILYRGFKIRDIGIKSNIGVCESNSLGNIREKDPAFKPMLCKKSIQRYLDNENLFSVFGA